MGINNRKDLAKYFNSLGFKFGAEIGVSEGNNAITLLENIDGLQLECIDVWKSKNRYETARKNLRNYLDKNKCFLYRTTSIEASLLFKDNSLDFIFIDGDHHFDNAMEDLIAWSRKVRKGGIISGHDYYNFRESGVIEAVNAFIQAHKLDLMLTGVDKDSPDDKKPSFYFIKNY